MSISTAFRTAGQRTNLASGPVVRQRMRLGVNREDHWTMSLSWLISYMFFVSLIHKLFCSSERLRPLGMVRSSDAASRKITELKEQQTRFQIKTEQSAQLEEIRRVVVSKDPATGNEVEDLGRSGDIIRAISSIGEELKAQRVAISLLKARAQKPTGQVKAAAGPASAENDYAGVQAEETAGGSWTDVVRRNRPRDRAGKATATAGPAVAPRRAYRAAAVMVKVSREEYPELAKKIRSGVRQEVIGDHIIGMRQCRTGCLLIEVRGDTAQVETVRAEVARSAGEEVPVRSLKTMAMVEVSDLDQWTTKKEEVANVLCDATGTEPEAINVVSMRQQFGGAQAAFIRVAKEVAGKLVEESGSACASLSGICRAVAPGRTGPLPVCTAAGRATARLRVKPPPMRGAPSSGSCSGGDRDRARLRINVDGGRAAHDLMEASAVALKADILIVGEPGRAAVVIANPQLALTESDPGVEDGFRWVTCGGHRYYACYWSPNTDFAGFEDFLLRLESSVRSSGVPVVVAGDFNAKSPEWGDSREGAKGRALVDWAASLDLAVCNRGGRPTFTRAHGTGVSSSCIDVSFVSRSLNPAADWRVLDDYTGSLHHYIVFDVADRPAVCALPPERRWSWRKLYPQKLQEAIDSVRVPETFVDAASGAEVVGVILNDVCAATQEILPTSQEEAHQTPVKGLAGRGRSREGRVQGPPVRAEESDPEQQGVLEGAVPTGRQRPVRPPVQAHQQEVARQAGDPRENGEYSRYAILDGPHSSQLACSGGHHGVPEITCAEVASVGACLPRGKAPGPDGVPDIVVGALARRRPDILWGLFNACLQESEFPEWGKLAKLVLLRKGDKPLDSPSAYRPICLLDSVGKFFERLIKRRIEEVIEDGGGFNDRHHLYINGSSARLSPWM
ncbi:Endonuclease/exonuclease/phosphatase [Cinara cedri]|uniref:Endonuclease/exonuclease/phosphatase n=1 Tax=Cinara cedri TaxID=506608 RepID=A0A5E4NFY4_9HEMI|nr:Endonuclease/exonuclease/phosphatase [Cinara cedri]